MSDEEKDMSYVYSHKSDGYAITLIGGDRITKPVYCVDCDLPHTHRPKDEPLEMTVVQALEHVNECHHTVNQGMSNNGYRQLVKNADRYNRWRVAQYLQVKETLVASRLKKVLAGG